MPYIHFTDEQKLRANSVDLVDFLQRQGEKLLPSGREKRLVSDKSITVRGNEWYDHANEQGGFAIDFVQEFYDVSFPEAVTKLLGGEQGVSYQPTAQKTKVPSKAFELPPAHTDMRRAYAYLMKSRFIDRDVLTYFAKAKLIYEDSEHHNAVFVGTDENGVARHAHKKSTNTLGENFRINVEGSNPAYSFHHTGQCLSGSTSNRLYVFEAPIDMLSFLSLHPKNWEQHSFVCLCGLSEHAMMKMLEQNPQLDHVVLCLDQDAAGIEAAEKFYDIISDKLLQCGCVKSQNKDWNEDLKAKHGVEPIPAEPHPQHLLRDEYCKQISERANAHRNADCSAATLAKLYGNCKTHLRCNCSDMASTELLNLAARSLVAAAKEYRQMEHGRDMSCVQSRMFYSFKAYQNRGRLDSRMDELGTAVAKLGKFSGVLTRMQKEQLAESYEAVAQCALKAAVKLVLNQQKLVQTAEVAPAMAMTM